MTVIVSDIPVPDAASGGPGRPARYQWAGMSVGDSIFFDAPTHGDRCRVRSSATQHGLYHGRKYMMRREGEGVRVWRIK